MKPKLPTTTFILTVEQFDSLMQILNESRHNPDAQSIAHTLYEQSVAYPGDETPQKTLGGVK